jgi:outer membrane immunogenic protein
MSAFAPKLTSEFYSVGESFPFTVAKRQQRRKLAACYNAYNFSGAHMNLKIGAALVAFLAVQHTSSLFAQALPAEVGSANASASSWVLGAEAGYNWQQGVWVYGLATDISATHLSNQANTVLPGFFTVPTSLNANIDWYGTVRGRLGWSFGPVLLYGTGGLAYGRLALSSSLTANPLGLNAQTSSVQTGWVAGVGIDFQWLPNLILNLEYQYVDLGSINVQAGATGSGQGFSTLNANAHGQFQVFTVGLSWLFNPANRAAHGPTWEGAYLGGHVGGAWGNDTSASYAYFPGFVSDIRLKRDIVLVGRLESGLGLYRYRYLWSDTVYLGVMAQEVALLRPDAIIRSPLDKYLRVDYARLGLNLMTLPE